MNAELRPRFELAGIVKRFGGVTALAGVDLAVLPGETHALLGENGAGKSTLIKVLTGAVIPDSGEIRVDGAVRHFARPNDARSAGIAAVYQEPMIYPHLSVLENIFAGNEIVRAAGTINRAAMTAAASPWLERLELDPGTLLRRRMGGLSLGYQQLVLIAKALVQEARLIIFDEPTSILSRGETDRLLAIIARLRAEGRSIVYITHRLDELAGLADRVTVLTDGTVHGMATAEHFDEQRLLQLMAGKSSRDYSRSSTRRHEAVRNAQPLLAIEKLSRKGVYSNVNWSVPAGVITGVYGLIGSGRSEVALAAFGALPADSGAILLKGEPVKPRTPAEAIRLGIGYLPEDRKLQGVFLTKALEANLTITRLGQFVRGLGRLDFRALRREASGLIRRYEIKAKSEQVFIGTLSGGNQQKTLFARWVSLDLQVLILDEPTRGIDVGTKAEIHNFIRQLADGGAAVMVISSDLPEVLAVSDRVIVMRQGSVAAVFEHPDMQAEVILAAAVSATRQSPGGHADARQS